MKLLVVDDEPLARDRLKRLLAVRGDCTAVAEAANGIEAIAANATQEPDVILLDIRMPGMDGIEAARHMMAAPHPPAIIFCTAYDEYAIAAFESRAVGYLLKPVQREKLDAALAAARASTRLQLPHRRCNAPHSGCGCARAAGGPQVRHRRLSRRQRTARREPARDRAGIPAPVSAGAPQCAGRHRSNNRYRAPPRW